MIRGNIFEAPATFFWDFGLKREITILFAGFGLFHGGSRLVELVHGMEFGKCALRAFHPLGKVRAIRRERFSNRFARREVEEAGYEDGVGWVVLFVDCVRGRGGSCG
jgi:hypothetical protein